MLPEPDPPPERALDELSQVEGFLVDQSLETVEVLTGLETRNHYEIRSSAYDVLYSADEEGGSVVLRALLGGWRAFEVAVLSSTGEPVVRVTSPFRLFFHEATITGAEGEPLGTIQRRSGILRRRYQVRDETDGSGLELHGTLLHPWTFQVIRNGEPCGWIRKRWNGLFAEIATDADRFEVDFPRDWPARHKIVLLGALLLLDAAHFESRIGHLVDLVQLGGR